VEVAVAAVAAARVEEAAAVAPPAGPLPTNSAVADPLAAAAAEAGVTMDLSPA
jgi:hypothetical protein